MNDLDISNYKKIIKPLMSEYRYNHCLNVSKEAVKLAKIYGANVDDACVAGLLHDITKEFEQDEQLQIISESGIILDNIQVNAPKLWHSISGSAYIKNKLSIDNEDILNAVRYHTTGRAGMSLLEKIIFIADYTSEERRFKGVDTMRKKSRKNLEDAMLFSYKFTFSHLTDKEIAIHPDELYCYNEIVLKNK